MFGGFLLRPCCSVVSVAKPSHRGILETRGKQKRRPPEIRHRGRDDLHKHYTVVGGVNAQQQIILPPRRVEIDELATWAQKHLLSTDEVVLEATTNAWTTYDLIAPMVQRCAVASPSHVRWIAEARVKTDAADVLRLSRLLAANLVPEVCVPPVHVRELRSLIAYRPASGRHADDD